MSPSGIHRRATLFFTMRHAPTVWNREGRIQGQYDSPLTDRGRHWATCWGKQLGGLGLDRILSSDTGRAVATADRVNRALNLPIHQDARLREQDWGRWTGRTMAEIRATHQGPFKAQEERGWSFCPPEGEERMHVLVRARNALPEAGHRWPQERILVISHEGVLKCLVYHLAIIQNCGQPFERMEPYRLHRLHLDGNHLSLNKMNALAFAPPSG